LNGNERHYRILVRILRIRCYFNRLKLILNFNISEVKMLIMSYFNFLIGHGEDIS